jgi:hypothetical protein
MRPVLLERDEAVRTQLQSDYDHILVDEYQDVNRAACGSSRPSSQRERTCGWLGMPSSPSIASGRLVVQHGAVRREDFPGGFETAWTSTTAPPRKSSAPSPPSRPA